MRHGLKICFLYWTFIYLSFFYLIFFLYLNFYYFLRFENITDKFNCVV